MILKLKILENRTGNIQTCKRLQKSGIKKDHDSKIIQLVWKNQQLLTPSNRQYTINRSNHRKKFTYKETLEKCIQSSWRQQEEFPESLRKKKAQTE